MFLLLTTKQPRQHTRLKSHHCLIQNQTFQLRLRKTANKTSQGLDPQRLTAKNPGKPWWVGRSQALPFLLGRQNNQGQTVN